MLVSWVQRGMVGPVAAARRTHRITETVRALNHVVQGLTGKKGPFRTMELSTAYPELDCVIARPRKMPLHLKMAALRQKWYSNKTD